jgi:uncharacterized membrane protein
LETKPFSGPRPWPPVRLDALKEPRHRPFLALAAVLLLLALALAIPATRGWLAQTIGEPLRAQADPAPGLRQGYTIPSLAFWALLGGVLAWALYELVFVRLRVEPDARLFLSLAPFLLFGPLFHALLVAGAFPEGSVLAYLATEPVIYLTTGLLAALALLVGHLTRRPLAGALAVGALALAPLVVLAAPRVSPDAAGRAGLLLVMAAVPAVLLASLFVRLRRTDPFPAVAAVIGAHALDGATTWMVLRDPFGMGFRGFGERNPVSRVLVETSNGWPYFAVKLALPLVLLSLLKSDEHERGLRAFLLFAVFVLGFGPGMSNLMQVMFG